jgi:hypothetical protein
MSENGKHAMSTPAEQVQQFHVAFALHCSEPMPRDELERLTFHAEEAINAEMPEFGASATAVFDKASIEFDLLVDAPSAAELHRRIAEVMGVLERAGFMMMLVSSTAAPSLDREHDDDLVPA